MNTDNIYQNNRRSSNDNVVSEDPRTTGNYYYSSSSSYESRYQSTASNPAGRRSPSPISNNRQGLGLNDFITKTNFVGNTSSATDNQYSVLGSMITSSRQRNTQNSNDDF